jgi:hypothetical protein
VVVIAQSAPSFFAVVIEYRVSPAEFLDFAILVVLVQTPGFLLRFVADVKPGCSMYQFLVHFEGHDKGSRAKEDVLSELTEATTCRVYGEPVFPMDVLLDGNFWASNSSIMFIL